MNRTDPLGLQDGGAGDTMWRLYGKSYAEYQVKCEADKQRADQTERNRVLVQCLAAKGGMEAAETIGEAVAVAVVSEVGGPEVGVPVTLLYSAYKANKLKKAYDKFDSAGDITECIQKAYGK